MRAFALIQGFSLSAGKVEKVANRKLRDQHRMSFLRSQKRRLQAVTSDPDIEALDAHADRLFDSVADVLAPIQLLGPLNVSELAVRMQLAYEAGNEEEFGASQRAFLAAAEKVLGIDGGRS
ncbi:hypothetical protein IFT36_04875 [Frigoribacterium sp. CFBP 13605]|uniref:hypothetical protein n=1 Tax=Frigoribacterium sp. CFBP 13605 TaxID=2774034 RepID=UPI0019068963|nr:hypothetical protein [Frigoribacterium sp. CFBP 13605]MBD8139877.1 hypothetical protein [Frigoribacterium sp. CFBP 13605]